ncbi:MAG: hypothetical protein WCF24_08625 [Acidimicrobiales bacterium]
MIGKDSSRRARFALLALFAAPLGALGAATSSSGSASASENPPVSSFATSVSIGGTTYAAIPMGELGDQSNTFWQLFRLRAGSTHWQLATPPGIADNGGLVIEGGTPSALSVAIRPSQYLTFTAIATAGEHSSWSNGGLIPGALVGEPTTFVGTNSVAFAAVNTGGGAILRSKAGGLHWAKIASASSLTNVAAGACRVSSVQSLATGAGSSLYAGANCSSGDRAGVFEYVASSWREIGPKLSALGDHASRSVLLLSTSTRGLVAVIVTSSSSTTRLVTARSSSDAKAWETSPSMTLPSSASIISTGALGTSVVYVVWRNNGVFAAISRANGRWQMLPKLPQDAETVAVPPGSSAPIDALGGHRSTFFAWRLDPRTSHWQQTETINVPIIYGSSQ